MKKFILTVLSVSVFFLGLGALVDNAGAKFKSDEKALDLIRKARAAVGGDSAIAGVQSMIVKGRTSSTVKINGEARTQQGETEIAMQLPDKISRMVKIGPDGDAAGHAIVEKQLDVVVVNSTKDGNRAIAKGEGKGVGVGAEPGTRVVVRTDDGTVKEFKGAEAEKVIVRSGDGATSTWTTKDGKTVNVDGKHVMLERSGSAEAHHDAMRHNEMLRFTLSLLLTAPQGMDVDYTFVGEADLDGTGCNVVLASFGGQSFKLFLDRGSNLPVGISFRAPRMPKVAQFEKKVHPPADGTKDTIVFHEVDASKAMGEFTIRFADYRAVNGVQLPFRWTQTVNGEFDETFDVTGYEINPADIGNRFQHQNVKVRTSKPDGK